jgi:hypothetical protein
VCVLCLCVCVRACVCVCVTCVLWEEALINGIDEVW